MAKRADDNGPFKAFDFCDWFSESVQEFWREPKCKPDEAFGEEFRAHMRSAWKEQLMAVRDVIDAAIEQLDPQDGPRKA
jgi:hypothetical protein